MSSRWQRLPAILAAFICVVAIGGYGTTLFWSWGFVAWGCACIVIGLAIEITLHRKAMARGVRRAHFGRPSEISVAIVASAILIGAKKDTVVIGVVMLILLIPALWRHRREASGISNGNES